jgi:hypothetical protein
MRHSPAQRSFLARIGSNARLANRGRSVSYPAPWSPRRMWRLAMAVGIAGAGFCLVLAMVVLVVALGGGSSTRPPPDASRTSTSPTDLSGRGHQRYRTTIVYEPRPVAGNGSASAVRYGLGLLVAQFHGAGSVRGDKFRITRPGDWGISWLFRCTRGHPGNLTVRADDDSTSNGKGEGYGRRLGHGNGKEPPGQAKKHKKKKKVPPGQAKKHKVKHHKAKHHKAKEPPGQAKKHGHQRGRDHQNSGHQNSGHQNSHVTFSASGYDGRGMSWYTSDPGDHTLDVVSGCSWAIKIVLPKP